MFEPKYHARTKHIELDMHFIKNKVLVEELKIYYIPSGSKLQT